MKRKKLVCETCSKSYKTSSSLARHKRPVHYKAKVNKDYANCFKVVTDFECDQCEKIFKRNDQLKRHKQSVHENIQLECPFCEKTFKRKDKLTKHLKTEHEPNKE